MFRHCLLIIKRIIKSGFAICPCMSKYAKNSFDRRKTPVLSFARYELEKPRGLGVIGIFF